MTRSLILSLLAAQVLTVFAATPTFADEVSIAVPGSSLIAPAPRPERPAIGVTLGASTFEPSLTDFRMTGLPSVHAYLTRSLWSRFSLRGGVGLTRMESEQSIRYDGIVQKAVQKATLLPITLGLEYEGKFRGLPWLRLMAFGGILPVVSILGDSPQKNGSTDLALMPQLGAGALLRPLTDWPGITLEVVQDFDNLLTSSTTDLGLAQTQFQAGMRITLQ